MSFNRPYFPNTSLSLSCGSAITRLESRPTIVSAAISALMTASSVACMVASKRGVMASLLSISTCAVVPLAAPRLAVEKAMKMSPELLDATLPVRARPILTLRARRFNW